MLGGLSMMSGGRSKISVEDVLSNPKWPEKWPFTPSDFQRMDESDDEVFYDSPRLVYHIDDGAINALTNYYVRAPVHAALDSTSERWRRCCRLPAVLAPLLPNLLFSSPLLHRFLSDLLLSSLSSPFPFHLSPLSTPLNTLSISPFPPTILCPFLPTG